jgi:hypothetical protein
MAMTPTREQVIKRLLELPIEIQSAESDLIRVRQKYDDAQFIAEAKAAELISNGTVTPEPGGMRDAQLNQLLKAEQNELRLLNAAIPSHESAAGRKRNEFRAYQAITRIVERDPDA